MSGACGSSACNIYSMIWARALRTRFRVTWASATISDCPVQGLLLRVDSIYHGIGQPDGTIIMTERHVKLFKNGRNQAVRIPREFELPGEDAIIRKDGQRLIIEPAMFKR